MSTPAVLTLEQGLTHLGSIVGDQHVALRGETIVASPGSTEEVAGLLRLAHGNGLIVMPSGGRTKVNWGNPVAPDIDLSSKRLCQVREHAWQDMTCTVQAGCSWSAMQAELKRHGQMVALDPLWPDRATVGGIVACNDSGAMRLKYGGLRDLIIGMTVVLPDGTAAKSGGKVVKNVAGYDIHKLMTGSFGTLGVIVEVNFRLHPLEEHTRTWTIGEDVTRSDPAAFGKPLGALMDSQITPSCVQLRVSSRECALDIRVAGPPECMDEYEERIKTVVGKFAISESGDEVWHARQHMFANEDAVVLKVSLLPNEICTVAFELQRWAQTGRLDLEVVAQATGLMTVAAKPATTSSKALVDWLRGRVSSSGGSVVVLEVPDGLRGSIDVWGPDRGTWTLMREIKRRFDPNRILNPGRFVGNI